MKPINLLIVACLTFAGSSATVRIAERMHLKSATSNTAYYKNASNICVPFVDSRVVFGTKSVSESQAKIIKADCSGTTDLYINSSCTTPACFHP